MRKRDSDGGGVLVAMIDEPYSSKAGHVHFLLFFHWRCTSVQYCPMSLEKNQYISIPVGYRYTVNNVFLSY